MEVRKVIINGDDFGKSEAVNSAIIQSFQNGILTSCSLMVTGEAFEQAVELARANPQLAVGLHLVLVCGRGALPHSMIPNLIDSQGNFSNNLFATGVKYYFSPSARKELRKEIWEQVKRFTLTGLPFSHVDGHVHMHMHPTIFPILIEAAEYYGVKRIRLPREDFLTTLKLSHRKIPQKLIWWSVFHLLSLYAKNLVKNRNFSTVEKVYGLLESGKVTEEYLLGLIPQLSKSTNEIYCHPEDLKIDPKSENKYGDKELEALLSKKVSECLRNQSIQLSTYFEL